MIHVAYYRKLVNLDFPAELFEKTQHVQEEYTSLLDWYIIIFYADIKSEVGWLGKYNWFTKFN